MDVTSIQQRLREFAKERDWEDYHSPKNLSMALSVEAAELMELFQWVTPEQSRRVGEHEDHFHELEEELADVAIYVLRLADVAESCQQTAGRRTRTHSVHERPAYRRLRNQSSHPT